MMTPAERVKARNYRLLAGFGKHESALLTSFHADDSCYRINLSHPSESCRAVACNFSNPMRGRTMKAPEFVLALALLAVTATPLALQAANDDYEAARKAALVQVDKARDVGYEWRDSRQLLKEADAAAKAGDSEKAIKLAKKVEEQGKAAVKQAKEQNNAGPK
jgi:hypothetical protein